MFVKVWLGVVTMGFNMKYIIMQTRNFNKHGEEILEVETYA